MAANAGLMVQSVLLLLLAFSIISWTIIIYKSFQIRKARRESYYFLELFWKSRSLVSVYNESRRFEGSPVAEIFRVGYQELTRVRKSAREGVADDEDGEVLPSQYQAMDNVQRALRRAMSVEISRLIRTLSFLATTGNTTPFIGLFGTVWGIMSSFHEIGMVGSANLAVVAPGISEALVATAAGLAAAIPAVVAFNYFNSQVRVLETEMTNFASDFLNILERDTLKKASGQR
ncbi:MAG: protein TolQ [Deltaproteobacteria bacterium]|nr:protein TolQ [Deltaproteobacteria bacterium]MBW2053079.1 protein TolQ [Deltaproteobacteria bacterium]MBW2141627.1 protein TolQ [Deltaproteobacteria bacterium]MBW2321905.1 protein TolQ [Deltaproteobacteria bacterium]